MDACEDPSPPPSLMTTQAEPVERTSACTLPLPAVQALVRQSVTV